MFSFVLNKLTFAGILTIYGTDGQAGNWWVPINAISQQENVTRRNRLEWLSPKEKMKINFNYMIGNWCLLNDNQKGYYVVNYDDNNWKALTVAFTRHLPPLTKAQLINDAISLYNVNALNGNIAFGLIERLKEESDFITWRSALANFNAISKSFINSKNFDAWKEYVSNIMSHVLNTTNFDDIAKDDHVTKLHKFTLLKNACFYDHPFCNQTIQRKLIGNAQNLPPCIKTALWCGHVKYGNSKTWESVREMYRKSQVPTEKETLLISLACSKNTTLLNRLLMESLDESFVKKDLFKTVVSVVSNSPNGALTSFTFFKQHYRNISIYLNEDQKNILKVFRPVLDNAGDENLINEIQSFLIAKKLDASMLGTWAKKMLAERKSTEASFCKMIKCPFQVNGSARLDVSNSLIALIALVFCYKFYFPL